MCCAAGSRIMYEISLVRCAEETNSNNDSRKQIIVAPKSKLKTFDSISLRL